MKCLNRTQKAGAAHKKLLNRTQKVTQVTDSTVCRYFRIKFSFYIGKYRNMVLSVTSVTTRDTRNELQ